MNPPKPFNEWLQENRDWLNEEWNEQDGEGGVVERYENGQDFIKWARLEHEAEVELYRKRTQQ